MRFSTLAPAAVLLLLAPAPGPADAAPAGDCGGLPRMAVTTAPGFCLGLAADRLNAPRGLLALANGDVLVADMGSWEPGHGTIRLLRRTGRGYTATRLFERLDRPNSLALGPDGKVYVGMVGRVARFAPGDAQPVLADVIGGTSGVAALPGRGRHLLPSILFDRKGNLVVGVGSASDHCENDDGTMAPGAVCTERNGPGGLGVIRRYAMRWPDGQARQWEVLARGLRNSMALTIDPRSGALWQGENARDAIHAAMPALKNDDELPHDELNAIVRGADYGWPYCYDDGVPSPEYPAADCRRARAPVRQLPAHAAPLGMTFYTGSQFPAAFAHSLLITYHGYRKHGHRVVALLDHGKEGPLGASVTLVSGERKSGKSGKGGKSGKTGMGLGAPAGIATAPDGSVFISDDRAGIVARLVHEGER